MLILWDVLTRTRIGVNVMFLFDACLSCYHLITVVVVDFAVAAVVAIVIIVVFVFACYCCCSSCTKRYLQI